MENNTVIELDSSSPEKQNEKKISCKYCQKQFSSNNLVKRHVDNVHQSVFAMQKINENSASPAYTKTGKVINSELIIQNLESSSETKKCVVCSMEFKTAHKLEKHLVESHFIPP